MRYSLSGLAGCLGLTLLLGCQGEHKENLPANSHAQQEHHEGDHHESEHGEPHHGEVAPHHGMLVELGDNENNHGELLYDKANHTFTLYVLDGKAEKNVSITQPEVQLKMTDGAQVSEFKLAAAPMNEEKGSGKSSRFELVDEKLGELFHKRGVTGHFLVNVNGTPFIGNFKATGLEDRAEK